MFGPLFGLHHKTLQFSVKIFFGPRPFFGLYLICLREKNLARASSPNVENRAKLQIIPPPQCSTKTGTTFGKYSFAYFSPITITFDVTGRTPK